MDTQQQSLTPGESQSGNDCVDWSIFSQILEMDEDEEEHEFTSSLVQNFFEQAEHTFDLMQKALDEKQLAELSSLGHFLKGSSAALGLTKITNCCEKIQNYGAKKDEFGILTVNDEDLCLQRIQEAFTTVKSEYALTQRWLKNFFSKQFE